MGGHVARIGAKRNAYRLLVVKPDGKRPLGRPGCSCVDNIEMNPRGTGLSGMDRNYLAQARDLWRSLVNTVMNHRVP
jgi:hypothetical protein